MGIVASEVRKAFNRPDPYEGFDFKAFPHVLQGGQLTPAMEQIFTTVRPKLIIEVGSWKGRSACFWASMMRANNIDGAVICVDTWLGGIEHIEERDAPEWDIRPYMRNGYPQLYYQFLANVMHEGLSDYIVPLPSASRIAARYLAKLKVVADIVYVDASHDEDDVYDDLCDFWPLLKSGGVICGDDFLVQWFSVICGVNRFVREKNQELQLVVPTWAVQKH